MRKYFVFMFCLSVAVLLNACGDKVTGKKPIPSSVGSGGTVQSDGVSGSDSLQSSDVDSTGGASSIDVSSSPAVTSTGPYALKNGDIITVEDWSTIVTINDASNFPKEITIIVNNSSTLVAEFKVVTPTLKPSSQGSSWNSDWTEVKGLTFLNGSEVYFQLSITPLGSLISFKESNSSVLFVFGSYKKKSVINNGRFS